MTVTEVVQETAQDAVHTVTETAHSAMGKAKELMPEQESPCTSAFSTPLNSMHPQAPKAGHLDCQIADITHTALSVSREAMSEARLPLQYRDSCAHLLIPLNQCRFDTYYLPWKCEVRNQLWEMMTKISGLTDGCIDGTTFI